MTTIKPPTESQLKTANMGLIPNPYLVVESNGDKVREWNEKNFLVVTGTVSITTQLYAVPNSWLEPTPPKPVVASDGSLYSSPLSSTKV